MFKVSNPLEIKKLTQRERECVFKVSNPSSNRETDSERERESVFKVSNPLEIKKLTQSERESVCLKSQTPLI